VITNLVNGRPISLRGNAISPHGGTGRVIRSVGAMTTSGGVHKL